MEKFYFETEKMSIGYRGKTLVKDIGIRLNKGEILTVLGPNGAGKSTLLKSIVGQLKLTGGAVHLDGKPLDKMSKGELSRKMAVVFTEKMQTELMTCGDVVATGRYPYTGRFGILSKSDHDIADEAMALVHVSEIRNQDFSKISDGQRQRVMLARAICQEPETIVMDEPVSFLDVRYKLEFLSALLHLREQKKLTVIMSLHEMELAGIISDKILCLKGGHMERYGTPGEVLRADFMEKLFDITEEDFSGNEKLLAYIDIIQKGVCDYGKSNHGAGNHV